MSSRSSRRLRIGGWTLDPERRELAKGAKVRRIEPKPYEVLELLFRRRGEVVPKQEILDQVWGGVFVTDHVLTVAISQIRKAFDDDPALPSVVETVPHTGYRLVSASREPDRRRLWRLSAAAGTSAAVAAALMLLSSLEPKNSNVAPAWEAYVKGRTHWARRDPNGIREANGYFERSLRHDPDFAPALVGLADCLVVGSRELGVDRHEAYRRARALAHQALARDPSYGPAHTTLAAIAFQYDWDLDTAEASFRRGLALDPENPVGHQWYAELLSATGRHGEAVREMRQALALDPLDRAVRSDLVWVLFQARRYREAMYEIDALLGSDRSDSGAWFLAFDVHERLGNLAAAVDAYASALSLEGFAPEAVTSFRTAARARGLLGVHAWRLEHAEQLMGSHVSPVWRSMVHAAMGDRRRAVALLLDGFAERDGRLPWVGVDPRFDGIRDAPELAESLQVFANARS